MIKGKCIHPQIMNALALCGHGDKVLIADGNYPLAAKAKNAEKVYLGLTPGIPTVPDVLSAIQNVCNIESAQVMEPDDGKEPAIFSEFKELLNGSPLEKMGRWEFYNTCCKEDVRLAISTGETRVFANILITIGCA